MGRYIGVDLHKRSFAVCYRSKAGEIEEKEYSMTEAGIEEFKKRIKKTDEVGVEATRNTGYFIREIENSVGSIKVINPTQFKIIANSVKKTDKISAKTIAKYLSK
ncbi:MAG TPA: transposase, partial [Candidatus Ratteibacteria bacterium]|nr:transposase [Candidatus Ratteibacteria bacterium]